MLFKSIIGSIAVVSAMGLLLAACGSCEKAGREADVQRILPSVETRAEDFVKDPLIGAWVSTAVFDQKNDKRLLYNFRPDGVVDVRWAFPETGEMTGKGAFPYRAEGLKVAIGAGKYEMIYPYGASENVLIMDGIKYVKTDMSRLRQKDRP